MKEPETKGLSQRMCLGAPELNKKERKKVKKKEKKKQEASSTGKKSRMENFRPSG